MNFNSFIGDQTKVSWLERFLFPLATPRVILRPDDPRKKDADSNSLKSMLLKKKEDE